MYKYEEEKILNVVKPTRANYPSQETLYLINLCYCKGACYYNSEIQLNFGVVRVNLKVFHSAFIPWIQFSLELVFFCSKPFSGQSRVLLLKHK